MNERITKSRMQRKAPSPFGVVHPVPDKNGERPPTIADSESDDLPSVMATHNFPADWTEAMATAMRELLRDSHDRLAVQDFLDTIGAGYDSAVSLESQCAEIVSRFGPSDVYGYWEMAKDWSAAVRIGSLVEVIGDAADWDVTMSVHVDYWVVEHANRAEAIRLADLLNHSELVTERACRDRNWIDEIVLALTHHVSPTEFVKAWRQVDAEEAAYGPAHGSWIGSWAYARRGRHERRGRVPSALRAAYETEVLGLQTGD